MKTQTEH